MTILETNWHWITGAMLGIEFLDTTDIPAQHNVIWGLVLDFLIIRLIFVFHKA